MFLGPSLDRWAFPGGDHFASGGVGESASRNKAPLLDRAEAGDASAQFFLGLRYATGEGVPQDDVTAHMWLNLAASRSTGEDREQAAKARVAVAARMTPEGRSEAQRLAREWDAAHSR